MLFVQLRDKKIMIWQNDFYKKFITKIEYYHVDKFIKNY